MNELIEQFQNTCLQRDEVGPKNTVLQSVLDWIHQGYGGNPTDLLWMCKTDGIEDGVQYELCRSTNPSQRYFVNVRFFGDSCWIQAGCQGRWIAKNVIIALLNYLNCA